MAVSGVLAVRRAAAQMAVANLDENRLLGTWYEIARLPNRQQKNCISDSVELIARWEKPGSLNWVNACITKAHYNDARTSNARTQYKRSKPGSTGEAKYKVYTVWPFSRKYWVLAVAPDNSWLLIGSPNHKSLWIYSKSSSMDPALLTQAKSQAASEGYDMNRIVMQPQSKQTMAAAIAP